MIQRIQTIYLLIAAIAAIIVLFIPIGEFSTQYFYFVYDAFSVKFNLKSPENTTILNTVYVALLLILTSGLSIASIFLYKNRKRQAKVISITMFVSLIAIFFMVYLYPEVIFSRKIEDYDGSTFQFNYWIFIIFITAVTLFLAKRAVLKDEERVRRADRLR